MIQLPKDYKHFDLFIPTIHRMPKEAGYYTCIKKRGEKRPIYYLVIDWYSVDRKSFNHSKIAYWMDMTVLERIDFSKLMVKGINDCELN